MKQKISTHLTLDSTLRYLYSALTYLEVPLMAIRFQFNDETWEADTIEEALALRAKLEYAVRFPPDPLKQMDKADRFWTPDRFMTVIGEVGSYQLQFLKAIAHQKGITSDRLRKHLGLDSEVALAGVISGLSKQLKQIGVELRQVIWIDVKWSGKKKTRSFALDDFFGGTGAELGWPDSWSEKDKRIEQLLVDLPSGKEKKDAQETQATAPTSAAHRRK